MAPDDQAASKAPAPAEKPRRGPGRPRKTPAPADAGPPKAARKPRAQPAPAQDANRPAEQAPAKSAPTPAPEPQKPAAGEAPPAHPLPDFDALALNLARLTSEGAKALAAYMRPLQEGKTNPDMAEHVEDAVKTFGQVAEYWLSDPGRAMEAQTRLTSDLIA